jgi:hypothetical protein
MTEQEIEKQFDIIRQRNRRVEADKAWEVSWTRRLLLAVIVYIFAGAWLLAIHDSMPLLKALIPVAGYVLSTLSLPFIKRNWLKQRKS